MVATKYRQAEKLTKKDIVSQINSVYDSLGLAAQLLDKLKPMMRQVLESGVNWKTILEQSLRDKWKLLCSEVSNATVTKPRSLTQLPRDKICIWTFAVGCNAAITACAHG